QDTAALTRALTGATGAYVLLPPPGWGQTGLAADRAAKTASLVAAVKAARPGHVVLLSSVGAELTEGNGPIKSLYAVEQGLRTTGVPVTFLRAAAFMENWGSMVAGAVAQGALYYGVAEGVTWPQVATEDIGKTAARLLLEGSAGGVKIVELNGPADASLQDVAAAIAKVSGKPVQGVSVPSAAMIQSLTGQGASAELAGELGEMADGISKGLLKFHGAPLRGTITLEQRLRAFVS
ncbi:MAG TPA: NmrA family NAD(P)-binding protein, partial [Kofleriaceae bacterium]